MNEQFRNERDNTNEVIKNTVMWTECNLGTNSCSGAWMKQKKVLLGLNRNTMRLSSMVKTQE